MIYLIVCSHNVSIDFGVMLLHNTHLLFIYFSIYNCAFKTCFQAFSIKYQTRNWFESS